MPGPACGAGRGHVLVGARGVLGEQDQELPAVYLDPLAPPECGARRLECRANLGAVDSECVGGGDRGGRVVGIVQSCQPQ